MTDLVFATNNKHKLFEAQSKIGDKFKIISLADLNFNEEIEETSDTIEGNAKIKAEIIYNRFGMNSFADDTGLEVEALNNAPGVYTARYAGENATFSDNCNKLLHEMQGKTNRNARFRTAICLILNGQHYIFEGMVHGKITETAFGNGGFGYDPVFMPDGYDKTFAELPLEIKNTISHRGKALEKLCDFLESHT
ncbi:MAG: non-canonical purine NTP diphosphatase [Bacteroidales bacterium]|nr:non-canonical purine NTP diphosphatase [Bacteroidales bacterium]